MRHRLNIVSIRSDDERTIIIRVIDLPNPGCAIVLAPGSERCLKKGPYLRAILRRERQMHRLLRLRMRTEPELRLAGPSESGPIDPPGTSSMILRTRKVPKGI